ncbi:MAG: YitT family protein [Lachnospiraceae bacterium]|nr:YitT family protein [Lachnospiraceae bacterium]MCI7595623.1 YitT family protein [Lachnospiraceae bacterium]MDD7049694.1 YitT family protein [Lachnospiraceae bacterium]MDY3223956.1 YitT family protein [Lachnospiraceae bacterium]MDY4097349.1 YitT family protein [Lachnospiraceae bacterium]
MSGFLALTREEKKHELYKLLWALIGATLYAGSINLFIIPNQLYNGGLMGFCQLFKHLLVDYLHLPLQNFDITGLIYYLLNIPIFFLSFNKIGKRFFFKTLCCVTWITLAMSIIPVPTRPILLGDTLGCCAIGGVLAGYGVGTMLKMGGSGGGMDIVGMLLIKLRKNFSVGKVNLLVNIILYSICLLLFDVPTVIYSLIYASVYSISMDRAHDQNINVEVTIITKKDCKALNDTIFRELGRGITIWDSTGAYTKEESKVLYILLSKYEVRHLKQIIREHDPHAFMVVNEGVKIEGNYLIKL